MVQFLSKPFWPKLQGGREIRKHFRDKFCFRQLRPFFFVALACHKPVVDGFDRHYQPSVHLPLSRTINKSLEHRIYFYPNSPEKNFRNAENRTQGCWVRSANATSVLCRPQLRPFFSVKLWLLKLLFYIGWCWVGKEQCPCKPIDCLSKAILDLSSPTGLLIFFCLQMEELKRARTRPWSPENRTRLPLIRKLPRVSKDRLGQIDRSSAVERSCQLHAVRMTRHGLLHKWFNISLLSWLDSNIQFCTTENNGNFFVVPSSGCHG